MINTASISAKIAELPKILEGKPQSIGKPAVAAGKAETAELLKGTPVSLSDARKKDVVELSPEAMEILGSGQTPVTSSSNPMPQGPNLIPQSMQNRINGWIGTIGSIVSQFRGQPATKENMDKLDAMLKDAGVHQTQLRPGNPNAANPNAMVDAQGRTIAQQFANAYNVAWGSQGTVADVEKIDGKVGVLDGKPMGIGEKAEEPRRAPGLQAPQTPEAKVVGAEKIEGSVEIIDRPGTRPATLSAQAEMMVNGWISRIRAVVSQFSGKEQTPENMALLETMLRDAGVSRSNLRPTDPNAPAGTYDNAPVASNGLTIAQMFERAYSVNWAS